MSEAEGCVTTAGFYGRKHKRKWIGLENSINDIVKKHRLEKIPKSFPVRILGPTAKWQIFHRQHDAFQFAKGTAKDMHVFAFESGSFEGNTGQRLYLTTSYPVFWHYYSQLEEDKRLHYEVIPEGAACKLYFDLEYDRTVNPVCDGNRMVDILITYVCRSLEAAFNLTYTRQDILDLEASTDRKFSRHLIFQMKTAVFKDNVHAGRFVCSMMSRLLEKLNELGNYRTDSSGRLDMHTLMDTPVDSTLETPLNIPQFQINTHEKVQKLDSSTSNNRSDLNEDKTCKTSPKQSKETRRILDSDINYSNDNETVEQDTDNASKTVEQDNDNASKTVEQDTDNASKTVEQDTDDISGRCRQVELSDQFDAILSALAVEDLQGLIVKNKNGGEILFCDTGVYTKNRNFRLLMSSKLGKKNPLVVSQQNEYATHSKSERSELEIIFYDSLVANVQFSAGLQILTFDDESWAAHLPVVSGRRKEENSTPECIDGYNKSPYPEVDEYITSIITGDTEKGVIRHWTYFQQGELLVYEIAKYRYCHNVGRQHRSNNIMLIADLQKGVCYQKCHDPDCHGQNFKSPDWPVPRSALPVGYFDDDLEMDDDELLNTTVELESQHMKQHTHCSTFDDDELDDGADDELVAAATYLDNTARVTR